MARVLLAVGVLLLAANHVTAAEDSPLSKMVDLVRMGVRTMLGGDLNPFVLLADKAMELFRFDDWKDRVIQLIEEGAASLSHRGQREVGELLQEVTRNPAATKLDFKNVLEKMKQLSPVDA